MSFASSVFIRRLSNWRRRILNNRPNFGQWVLPQQCLLCTAPDTSRAVCDTCYTHLPWLTTARCPQCALPTHEGRICGACLAHPPRFDKVSAAFEYAWPLTALIHQFKYAG